VSAAVNLDASEEASAELADLVFDFFTCNILIGPSLSHVSQLPSSRGVVGGVLPTRVLYGPGSPNSQHLFLYWETAYIPLVRTCLASRETFLGFNTE
jgi:hypothetical protein